MIKTISTIGLCTALTCSSAAAFADDIVIQDDGHTETIIVDDGYETVILEDHGETIIGKRPRTVIIQEDNDDDALEAALIGLGLGLAIGGSK